MAGDEKVRRSTTEPARRRRVAQHESGRPQRETEHGTVCLPFPSLASRVPRYTEGVNPTSNRVLDLQTVRGN